MPDRKHPSAAAILKARRQAGHTQDEAAQLVGLGSKKRWSEYETGVQPMDLARWTLYLLLTNQHPELEVIMR